MNFLLKFVNKKISRLLLTINCALFVGDRGSGKSTLMALVVRVFNALGYKIYCQYPYKGAYIIPMVEKTIGKVKKKVVDKEWLYTANLSHSVVMIDEARTVWNARAYSAWTESDEEFFNFLRKNDTILICATQCYDGVDLNVRRACDYTFFIQQGRLFKNWSTVDVSRSVQIKVADKNTQVVSRGYSKNAMKVTWEIGEIPIAFCYFWRKPYYGDFLTLFTADEKPELPAESWDFVLENSKVEQNEG